MSDSEPTSGLTLYFFITNTCKGIMKSSGVRKFCPNSEQKQGNFVRTGLTSVDCISDFLH